ncbi:MAG: cyclophilin-like fold protein [Chordicoccus sp.]
MQNITITDGNTTLRAVLNDTMAARDFVKRLPFTVSGYDSGIDYCCSAASGLYDPMETQTGWKNGDISLGGGWFALLYGGQEQSSDYRDMMIIGHIRDEDLGLVKKLPQRVTLKVSLAQ